MSRFYLVTNKERTPHTCEEIVPVYLKVQNIYFMSTPLYVYQGDGVENYKHKTILFNLPQNTCIISMFIILFKEKKNYV